MTANGHTDLRNGFPDWVYPEELDQYDAFWWSPDSRKIAFMQFDESPVGTYPIVHDVSPAPELEMQRYPKAGANNPIVLNLGQIELADHVAAAKFISQRPYVDGGRVGIYGHSYGGYLTCIALLKAPDVFHVRVAGAPVTDWRNYDTIYTERYMRRPQDNPEGYEKGSCITNAKNLKGHLFIHHGAVDDNVHPGNAIQLVEALLKADKKFDFMFYPEQRHGIRFPFYAEARVEYFIEHLKPEVK